MAMPRELSALAANLACRRRLGLGQVLGSPDQLDQLLSHFLPPKPSPQNGESGLEAVRQGMGQCTRCPLHKGRRNIVFGQGPDRARIMFIGEAPGAREDEKGVPFVGPAGKLLDRMLKAVGLERSQVYITNIVKCRPPGNRDPLPEEAAACRPFLEAQVQALNPEIICALGRPSAQSLLSTKAPISALRGNWHQVWEHRLLPTFHPAFLLRQPERKREAYQDMKKLVRALAKTRPEED
ncbi:MAG: uracil-DNA glycosylase [Desulfarculaceae bacterium]